MRIQIDLMIRWNDKIQALCKALGVSTAQAIGHLVCLWTYVASKSRVGYIGSDPLEISKAAVWDGDCSEFTRALFECKLLEPSGRISEWSTWNGSLARKEERNKKRKQKDSSNEILILSHSTSSEGGSYYQEEIFNEEKSILTTPTSPNKTSPSKNKSNELANDPVESERDSNLWGLVREFSFCLSPIAPSKKAALSELIRLGVKYDDIKASARDESRRGLDFYEHMKLLRNSARKRIESPF